MQRHRGQSGYSLLEALIAIVLTSMVIVGLAGALLAAIRSSEVARRVQRADSALGSFTESLKTMPYPDAGDLAVGNCPSVTEYQAAWSAYADRWIPPADIAVSISGIEHWQPTGTDKGSFTAACPAVGEDDPYANRLTVTVEIDGDSRNAQVVVTKR